MNDSIKKVSRQATDQEEIFAKNLSGKGLLFKILKELLKLNNKKANDPVLKRAKNFIKREVQKANKHVKRCSSSNVIEKCKSE